MEACGMSFIKYLLFFFNLIFALSGLVVLVVGAVVLANVMEYGRFVDGAVLTPPIILIVLGGVIFIIAFLGCCGAIKENYYMLIAFAVLLAVIFVVELAVGIAAGVAKDEFTGAMRESLRGSMLNYTKTKLDRQTWDNMHRTLKCCGLDSPRNWGEVVGNDLVPASCCLSQPLASTSDPPTCQASTDKEAVYQQGCYEKVKVKIKDNIIIIMGVGLGIAMIELAGIVLACCLAASIRKEQFETLAVVLRLIWKKNIDTSSKGSRNATARSSKAEPTAASKEADPSKRTEEQQTAWTTEAEQTVK